MTESVTLGARAYTVTVIEETVRRTIYRVTCDGQRPRGWRPAEVRVGAECVFACLVCRTPPDRPCLHVEIVRQFVASQPLEAIP
jgi:hypothetical protein